jgi:hypothetical protein
MEKHFPNGFTSWQETHYEIVSMISFQTRLPDSQQSELIRDTYAAKGTGGMYELAEELTDEFETLNEGRIWDGEYFDEIEEFINQKFSVTTE